MKYFLAPAAMVILLFTSLPGYCQDEQALRRLEHARILLYQTFNSQAALNQPDILVQSSEEARVAPGGRYGQGLKFSAPGEGVALKADGNWPPSAEFSEGCLAFWIKHTFNTEQTGFVAALFTVEATGEAQFQVSMTEERLLFTLPDQNHLLASAEISWSSGQWHHIGISWVESSGEENDAEIRLLLDGDKIMDQSGLDFHLNWPQSGARIVLGCGFQGCLDDLMISGRALASREIRRIYNDPEGVSGVYLSFLKSRPEPGW
jgi:hypothetical protein